jgi:glycosyltransferase involved in cell wall biosynthesis
MKTLLLIPSYAKVGIDAAIAADRHPTMDYQALASALSRGRDDEVELLDYASVDRSRHPAVQLAARAAGRDSALAVMGFLRRNEFDTIFSNAEKIALPLSALFRPLASRPRHVTIAHRLTAKKKQPFYRWLKLFKQMDRIFVYSSAQYEFACSELGIPRERLKLIQFHAEHSFYRPLKEVRPLENQICAAGLEWRDYPTFVKAVGDLSELTVRLAAASPWSKHSSALEGCALPAQITARSYDYLELRSLYAESSFVVVPLLQNDFQAGVTTILEAMAMAKPVIVTGTIGQTDVIVHEQNGLYVDPGDVAGLRAAVERLRSDGALRNRLGRAARRWVEEHASLDRWVAEIVEGVRGPVAAQPADPMPAAATTLRSLSQTGA